MRSCYLRWNNVSLKRGSNKRLTTGTEGNSLFSFLRILTLVAALIVIHLTSVTVKQLVNKAVCHCLVSVI